MERWPRWQKERDAKTRRGVKNLQYVEWYMPLFQTFYDYDRNFYENGRLGMITTHQYFGTHRVSMLRILHQVRSMLCT